MGDPPWKPKNPEKGPKIAPKGGILPLKGENRAILGYTHDKFIRRWDGEV